jgi:hypothetical protein
MTVNKELISGLTENQVEIEHYKSVVIGMS